MSNNNKKSIYYWVICACCTIIVFITAGVMLNSFSTYYPYFREMRGFSDSQLSLLITVRSAASIVAMFFVNKFFGKLGLKRGIILGIMFCIASLAVYAYAYDMTTMIIATSLAGVGSLYGSTYPVTILINRWFIKRKGTALSICISGTGLATVFVPNLTVTTIDKYGLSSALLITALISGILGLASASLLSNSPQNKGLVPYGQGEELEAKVQVKNNTNISISRNLTVIVLIVMAMQGIAAYETTQLFTLHYTNSGFSTAQAASALAVWGGVLTVAKLIYGPMADKFGIYKVNYFSLIFATLGIGLCCLAYTQNYYIILIASVCIGISFPYNTIGVSLWASSLYSQEDYAKAYQQMNLSYQIGVMVFSAVPGIIANKTGSYTIPYIMFTVMMFAALSLIQFVFIKHSEVEKNTEVSTVLS